MPKPLSLMPGPKIYPIVGSVLEYSRFGKYTFEKTYIAKQDNYKRYGKIYRERMGRDIVQLFDPADIETVQRAEGKYPNRPCLPLMATANKRDGKMLGLGSLNGEDWWALRQPAQQSMMKADAALPYLPLQNHVADQFLALLQQKLYAPGPSDHGGAASEKDLVVEDILPLITRYTTEVFGVVCFQAKIGCLEPDISLDHPSESGSTTHSGSRPKSGSRSESGPGSKTVSGCPDVALRLMSATNRMFNSIQQTTFAFPSYTMWRTKMYNQFIESTDECHSVARAYVEMALAASDCPHLDHISAETKQWAGAVPKPGVGTGPKAASESGLSVGEMNKVEEGLYKTCPNFLHKLLAENSGRLSLDHIIQLAVDLFTAGIDSTANAVAFCLYNLARNPDKQRKLIEELDKVLPGRAAVTGAALQELKYLQACVKESFRTNFPVEGGAVRQLDKDLVLSDYLVPKGTLVALNYQTMCLDQQYYPRPLDFIPERWLRAERSQPVSSGLGSRGQAALTGLHNSSKVHSYSFLPFGHGSRMCIGRRFALQEIYLALIKILQNYEIECHKNSEVLGMLNRVFTMPDRPVSLILKPR